MKLNLKARVIKQEGNLWGLRAEYWDSGSGAAGCIFFCPATRRWLVSFRSAHVMEPHTWGIWGGKLDGRETPLEAVKREAEEETGHSAEGIEFIPSYVYQDGSFKYRNFIAIVDAEFEPEMDWETEGFRWCKINEFPNKLHFGLKALYPYLVDFDKGYNNEEKQA
jgi:8-oxo-dGTP pyrophosphatase MutT (NUDIX family)